MKIIEVITKEYYYQDENGKTTLMPFGVVDYEENILSVKYNADGYDENGYDRNGLDKNGKSVFDDLGEA